MKTVALIPLRGGSKSITNKNIKNIAGKPLAAWVLEAALNAVRIDDVYVSTDSAEIKDAVSAISPLIKVIDRPKEYATDTASTEAVMLHFMSVVECDCLVTIQATSPLLKSQDIDAALDKFNANNYDSLLSVVETKRFYWTKDGAPISYDPSFRPRRQEFDGMYMENGAFYITKKNLLAEQACRLGGKIGLYLMDAATGTEIDELCDWLIVEALLKSSELDDN